MSGRELRGVPAAPGIAVGVVRQLAAIGPSGEHVAPERREGELGRARAALEQSADQLEALADRLAAQGRADDAEIVATGALMARDPSLDQAIGLFVLEGGLSAPDAILEACATQADLLAGLPDAMLAARADDVRSLGRRAALLAAPDRGDSSVEGRDEILVAEDLGPADVAELEDGVRGIVLAGGGATAHAAIVARGLGLPLVAGLGSEALALERGELVVVDGAAGLVVASPSRERADAARDAVERSERARSRARSQRDLPAETVDRHRVTVLANVAGVAELELALEAGAEGIGLLRTELGFLDAGDWPSEEDHMALLAPILDALGSLPATVRVLDFGADKTPPFLAREERRGIELLLGAPEALGAQLRAILRARANTDLRVLAPMVSSPLELAATAEALSAAAHDVGAPLPALGPMIETPGAACAANLLADGAGFMSIGTNDLSAAVLGVDRFAPGVSLAHHPRVLGAIAATVRAAQRAGIRVEVCGEAASDPTAMPLLVGLGVDELSVAASRVGTVRAWVRELDYGQVEELAGQALWATSPEAVQALVAPVAQRLASAEGGDAVAQGVERERGVFAAGGQA
jgi:phosphoenolpyruvate-protein kinase (PTS system EI component)